MRKRRRRKAKLLALNFSCSKNCCIMDDLFVTKLCSSTPFSDYFIAAMSSPEIQCFTVLEELKRVFSALQLAWPETLTSVVR